MQVEEARRPNRLVRGGTVSVLLAAFYICFFVGLPAEDAASHAAASDASRVAAHSTFANARPRLLETYGRLPLSFEVNRGQAPSQVDYLARGAGYTLFLTGDGATLVLSGAASAQGAPHTAASRSELSMRLAGANSGASVGGVGKLPGEANYFLGNNPKLWRTHIPTFGRVAYHNVYPGVDLVYYGHSGQLEYDFVVAPGADLSRIKLALDARPHVTTNGDLALAMGPSEVRFQKPVIYQTAADGSRRYLDGGYVIASGAARDSRVGFRVPAYDRSRPLVIDPTFTYSTYLGGTGTDSALGIAVDSAGDVYVTGQTSSTNFPVKGPEQGTSGGGTTDAFVTEISADGLSILYSTYLGGSGNDVGAAIAIDVTGSAYVTGNTNSTNFPVTTGAKQTTNGGLIDAFVTKLNAGGASLNYSTYSGGSQNDYGNAIAVDSAGEAYVAGETNSNNFIATKGAFQAVNGQGGDAFFMVLDPSGTAPAVYATFLGGSGADAAEGIALSPSCVPSPPTTYCDAYITGQTSSLNFPVSSTAFQKSPAGGTDAFVAEINPAASGTASLIYSTYFGGTGNDIAYGVAVDATGDAYFAGSTTSSSKFPVSSGAYQSALSGTQDAFVAELDAGGSTLAYSTYLGGSGVDSAAAIAIDTTGDAFVTGNTTSTNFVPASVEAVALQSTCATTSGALCDDAFVAAVGPGGTFLTFASYLGGGLHDAGNAIAVDANDNVYVAGATLSTDFPSTAGVFQPACATSTTGACGNAFIAEIGPTAPDVQLTPQIIPYGAQPLGVPSPSQTVTVTNNSGSAVTFSSIATTGNYQVNTTGTSCFTSVPLSAGASCAIAVSFTPNAAGDGGANAGTLVLTDNAAGSPQVALLKGTGVTSVVALTPASLSFNSQFVGTTSAPQTVTLVNSGSATLNITSVAVTAGAGFAQTNNCGTSVAAGSSCTISVSFTPTGSGTASGTLSVTDNTTGSPQTVGLTGTGVSPTASLSATTVNFGSLLVGTGSTTPQKITLTNTGNANLSITSLSISGSNASEFTINPANPCGSTVAQGSSCTIQINFKPVASNPPTRSATLSITDNAPNSPQTVALTGMASDFQLSATPGSQTVNPGQTTTYNLTVTPVGGFTGNVSLSCKGQPINTSCNVSLPTANLSGTSPVTATVTVVTSAPSAAPWNIGRYVNPRGSTRMPWQVWLALGTLLAILSFARRRARAYVLIAGMLIVVSLWMGCGSSLQAPANVAAGTPAGNYTLTLNGTAGGVGHTITTTLVVN
jgi:hypothetical protein